MTTNSDDSYLLEHLIFDAKLRNSKTDLNSTIMKNMVSFQLENPEPSNTVPYKSNNYEICIKIDLEKRGKDDEDKLSENDKEKIVKEQSEN